MSPAAAPNPTPKRGPRTAVAAIPTVVTAATPAPMIELGSTPRQLLSHGAMKF